MKTAVQIGAGNIGRGFIGALLSQTGRHVTFADVNMEIINRINAEGKYTVHIADVNPRQIVVSDISGISSADGEAMNREIVRSELITTAVGPRILPHIAPAIASGISARFAQGVEEPLNIIACENAVRATSQLKTFVYERLSPQVAAWADRHVGFVDCSVDRIVPPVRSENPLDVAVEEFFEWNVEKTSFIGSAPRIEGMNLVGDLSAYIERKLFTLNTGHAITAYLGAMKGIGTIDKAIADERILGIVSAAMRQSGAALVRRFGFDEKAHYEYIGHIIQRFGNPCLQDDVMRVGREPLRKLSASDRLLKPILTAAEYGLPYDSLLLGVGAALHFDNPDDPQSVELQKLLAEEGLAGTVVKVCSLEASNPLVGEIVEAYSRVEREIG